MLVADVKEKLIHLLPFDSIDDAEAYSKELDIYIASAIEKMKSEGVREVQKDEPKFDFYCVTISYDVAQHLFPSEKFSYFEKNFKTNVLILRDTLL